MKAVLLVLFLLIVSQAQTQTHVLYDDDCTNDNDCPVNFATLHKLADAHEITILATIANSANPLAAPAMKIFNTYYGRPGLPIGANQTPNPANLLCEKMRCNWSSWLPSLVSHYDLGDTRANFPDCVTTYRQTLAAQPDQSVVIVSTGFLTCIAQLLASPADAISPLTGPQLIQAKVTKLVVMGGAYPHGSEFNLAADPADTAAVLTTWTSPNHYPPIFFISFADGAKVLSGPPPNADPTVNPGIYAFQLAHSTQRGSWDSMSILYAARGLAYNGTTYWTDSGDGNLSIDLATGVDTFSPATPSGHHFLINVLSDEKFSAIFDGFRHKGFASLPPSRH